MSDIRRIGAGPRMSKAVVRGKAVYTAGQVAEKTKGGSVADQTREILGLIDELLGETGTRAELTQAAYARFREASDRYGENAGEMTVCKVLEDDAGINLRVEGDWTPPWEVKHPSEH